MQAAKTRQDDLLQKPPQVEKAYAVWEGQAADARIHIKGDPKQLGEEVPRGFLQVLGGQTLPPQATGSGRYELAQWLTDPKNPLTARVIVNRIWQHHFGKGLVTTPNDFGIRGLPPTHPELLDWLAAQFIKNGWSFKAMHKLILLSSTYQLSSGHDPRNARIDPANHLLWRFDRRRLDAEEIRDALLATSGALDLTMGGRHPFPPEDKFLFTQHKPFGDVYDSQQRSVYLMRQRRQSHPYLDLFDAADPKATTAARSVSTTPLQALFMMNSALVQEQAQRLSARLIAAEGETGARITLAHRLIVGRPPTSEEVREGRKFLDESLSILEQEGMPPEERAAGSLDQLLPRAVEQQRVHLRRLRREGIHEQFRLRASPDAPSDDSFDGLRFVDPVSGHSGASAGRRRSEWGRCQPAGPEEAASPGPREAGHPSVHEWRRLACGYVRSKTSIDGRSWKAGRGGPGSPDAQRP